MVLEKTAQKQTHKNTVNRSVTKEQRQLNEDRMVFSTNGAGMSGHLHAKKKKTLTLGVPVAQWVTNASSIHEDSGLILGPAQWVKDPGLP